MSSEETLDPRRYNVLPGGRRRIQRPSFVGWPCGLNALRLECLAALVPCGWGALRLGCLAAGTGENLGGVPSDFGILWSIHRVICVSRRSWSVVEHPTTLFIQHDPHTPRVMSELTALRARRSWIITTALKY